MLRTVLASDPDPYLYMPELPLNVISIFDDLTYDRSDYDGLSPGMRRYIVRRLGLLGFKQKSGNVIVHEKYDVRCLMIKASVLGASPFDATRYCAKREQDYYILTPTQTAALMIDRFPLQESVDRILALVSRHPINVFKLKDFLESCDDHEAFLAAIPHIKYHQRLAVEASPLRNMKCLKAIL